MSTKITIVGARLSKNLGAPSMLLSVMKVLNQAFEEPQYTYISPTDEDLGLSSEFGIPILSAAPRRRIYLKALASALLGLKWKSKRVNEILRAFREADLVVEVWGIAFSDSLGSNDPVSRGVLNLYYLLGKRFGKPVVKYTADLGPFRKFWNRLFARYYLGCCADLILARSQASKDLVERLGVRTPVLVAPDTAFLLPAQETALSRALRGRAAPLTGFSASFRAAKESGDSQAYITAMAAFADAIVERTGGQIVLIPNELSDIEGADDLAVMRGVHERMSRREDAVLVEDDFSAPELKGIVAACDAVVSARYHTMIAALSQGIPCMAVGWHFKYEEVMKLFGQERYVLPVDRLNGSEMESLFGELWQAREERRAEICGRLEGIRAEILNGGEQVRRLHERSAHPRR